MRENPGRVIRNAVGSASRPAAGRKRSIAMHWVYLAMAIIGEVIGTSALNASAGFTRMGWLPVVMVGYSLAFFFLGLALRAIPVGVAYAIWAGVGVALIALIGWVLYGQRLDAPALLGIGLIVAGVVVLQTLSGSVH